MEPIYEYVKGEGWKPVSRQIVTFACGTVCSVERTTQTKPGERYFTFWRWRDINNVKAILEERKFYRSNDDPREEYPDYYYYVVTPL